MIRRPPTALSLAKQDVEEMRKLTEENKHKKASQQIREEAIEARAHRDRDAAPARDVSSSRAM